MFTLNCKGRILSLKNPIVMGILNITPDSFYSESRANNASEILMAAEKMINDGATILDIGGQSTRPGANEVGVEEELIRVLPAIQIIRRNFPDTFISIDTYHSAVAIEAVQNGADSINDISGGTFNEEMILTVAKSNVPYICMHIQGSIKTMQENPQYENVTNDVLDFFIRKIEECKQAGIKDIIVDPGFGFGKTIEHNFTLLAELESFSILQKPLLIGVSRKSIIYKTLGISAKESLNGTTVLNTIGLLKSANILRVHDVKEAMEAIKLCNYIH